MKNVWKPHYIETTLKMNEASNLYQSKGMSTNRIAKKMGISQRMVYRYLKAAGVECRQNKHRIRDKKTGRFLKIEQS